MAVFEELRRRNVHRVAIAYLAGAWLLVQVVETLLPAFDWSGQALRIVLVLLAIGFIPALILSWVFEWTPDGLRRETDLTERTPRTGSRRFDRFITVVLVIAVAYFAVDKFVFDPDRDRAEIAAATEEATNRALSGAFLDEFRDRSILVVPFLNMSTDPEQEYFADGISEELLNVLARIEDLRVISRMTSWTFKGKDVDVAEVHRKLNVSYILEGSVRKAGNRLRITAQLIDARTDTHLWSGTYDRTLEDLFAIQDEISVAVAEQLHIELFHSDSPHKGVDPRAYELYLRASIDPVTSGAEPTERVLEVRRLLEEALAIEPDYPAALYNLLLANEVLRRRASPRDEPALRQGIVDLFDRLVMLAPGSVFANNWRAYIEINWYKNFIVAAPFLEKALRFANRTDVHVYFKGAMELLHKLGRDEEAVVVGQYWASRDPACSSCIAGAANAMRHAGLHREAALVLESLLDWRDMGELGYWVTGVTYLVAGEPGKALSYFDRIDPDSETINRNFARAFALYSLGRIDEFESALARELASRPENTPEGIARLYAWSNQRDKAFEWLEIMIAEQGVDWAESVKTDLYEPIKSDPRWQDFLERYGAADQEPLDIEFNPHYPPALQRAVDALATR